MRGKTVFLLLSLLVLLLILISLLVYQKVIPGFTVNLPLQIDRTPTAQTSATPRQMAKASLLLYKNALGETLPLGISNVKKDDNGNSTVTLIGTLEKLYQEKDRYFLDLSVPTQNNQVVFQIDLGGKSYVLAEYNVVADQRVSPARYISSYTNTTSADIFQRHQKNIGRVIRVDILTKVNEENFKVRDCSQICQTRLEELQNYSSRNQKLESGDISLFANREKQQIGVPVLISVGS